MFLTCAQKLTYIIVIYRTEPKSGKQKKLKSKKTDKLRTIGKQSEESMESLF